MNATMISGQIVHTLFKIDLQYIYTGTIKWYTIYEYINEIEIANNDNIRYTKFLNLHHSGTTLSDFGMLHRD